MGCKDYMAGLPDYAAKAAAGISALAVVIIGRVLASRRAAGENQASGQ